MILKIFKTEAGFSLVQGMIIAGVLAGSGLVATRLITDQKLAQRGAETRDSIEQLHGLIYSILQNKDHCSETFAVPGLQLASGTMTNKRIVEVPTILSAGTEAVRKVDRTYMNGQVTVSDMRATYPIREGFGQLEIMYRRLDSNNRQGEGYGGKDIKKTILLRVQKNSTGGMGCYAVTEGSGGNEDLNKEFCQELGLFEWNEENSTCELRHNVCEAGEVSAGITSTGQVKCINVTDYIDFNNIIDQDTPCVGASKQFEVFNKTKPDGTVVKRVRIKCF